MIAELLDFAREYGLTSFMFSAEAPGRRKTLHGVVGRYRADPTRGIGELTIMRAKLVRMAEETEFADSIL